MSVKSIDTKDKNEVIDISYFYKENKKESETVQYIASDSFVNPDSGEPLEWTLKPVSAEEDALIRKSCTTTKENRRTGVINEIFDDNKYLLGLTARGVKFPNLNDRGLQSTYGTQDATTLLKKMLSAGELQSLALKVIEVSGLDDIEASMNENERKAELLKNN